MCTTGLLSGGGCIFVCKCRCTGELQVRGVRTCEQGDREREREGEREIEKEREREREREKEKKRKS